MSKYEELLQRHKPQLRYDSNEAFFADSAAIWTDNPANSLRRKPPDDQPGVLLAAALPRGGEAQLGLGFLAPLKYGNGEAVEAGDFIGCPRHDYRDQYVALRQRDREAYANRMYGRAKEDLGRVWLQYWFFYFYNDYNLAGGLGLHEGDWEMVQFRIADGGAPDLAVYAQHRWAEVAPWEEVEKAKGSPDTPIVYVARGSHASYFHSGYHETEAWYDLADGKRRTPELRLEVVTDDEPSWVGWPGIWGGTRADIADLEQPSPDAPCRHRQWEHPATLLDTARAVARSTAAPPPPVTITRNDGHLRLSYDFGHQGSPRPEQIVVTVNSEDDAIQPRTFTFAVDPAMSAEITTAVELGPNQSYDVYVSVVDVDGRPSDSELTLIRPRGVAEPHPIGALTALGRLVAWIRRLFGRN